LDSSALLKEENSPQTPRHSQAMGCNLPQTLKKTDPRRLLGGKTITEAQNTEK
jgi:hypothetical protein